MARQQAILAARWDLAFRLSIRDPRLLIDYIHWYLTDRVRWHLLDRAAAPPHGPARRPIPGALTPASARRRLADAVGEWTEGPALARVRAWAPAAAEAGNRALGLPMACDASVGELLYGLVRALRPDVVVETGVASGVNSAYILAGLADNRAGALHSVDLPPTRLVAADLVGDAVPTELRNRWVYHWGSARRLLPKVLNSTRGAMGIFVHDSAPHHYPSMRWELEHAWPALVPGGWLIADEASFHTAFEDVAAAANVQPIYALQSTKPGCTGLLRKPL